jgi:uncharacterized protein (DUF2236 family)
MRAAAALVPNGLPGARWALRIGLERVFGPPSPVSTDQDPADPGLFGPGSASWQVIAEPAAIVGGVRALLVQLLHPLAMAGVADHSQYGTDPIGRLQRTSAYVTRTTFGTSEEVLEVARRVRLTHRRVQGTAPDGRPYRASDPELLAWVSIALTSSFLATDAAYATDPVSRTRADAFVAEQSRGAALLDPRVDLGAIARDRGARDALCRGTLPLPLIEEGLLPTTSAQLQTRIDDLRPSLEVNEQGREALRFLLWPHLGPVLRTAYLPILAGAVATLDGDLRRRLGIRIPQVATVPMRGQTRLTLGTLRTIAGTSPAQRQARERLERARADGRRTPAA